MLRKPIYPSHDGLIHVERINQFHQSFILGKIPPRVAPTFAENIGYPFFIANYQLPYYFAEIFMIITNDAFVAFKSTMAVASILSCIFAFLLFKNFSSTFESITGALIFSYTPYRFANLYTRGAFGEVVSMMFVPIIFLAIHQIVEGKKSGLPLLSIALFGLITSHTVIFILFLPVIIFYTLFFVKVNKQSAPILFLGIILAISLSSFQLMPIIFERKYTRLEETFLNIYSGHYISWHQLFRIPKEGINLGSPFQIGIPSTLLIILSFAIFIFKKHYRLLFFLIVTLLSILATLKVSRQVWDYFPIIRYIIFPWRFLAIVSITSAFLGIYILQNIKLAKIFGVLIIFLAIFTSRHYFLKPTQYESTQQPLIPMGPSEYDTIWTNKNTYRERSKILTLPSSSVTNLFENGTDMSFNLKTEAETVVILRRLYFPGWKLKLNGFDYKIIITDGLISFEVPKGVWQGKLYFSETPVRRMGNIITIISAMIILFLLRQQFTASKKF